VRVETERKTSGTGTEIPQPKEIQPSSYGGKTFVIATVSHSLRFVWKVDIVHNVPGISAEPLEAPFAETIWESTVLKHWAVFRGL